MQNTFSCMWQKVHFAAFLSRVGGSTQLSDWLCADCACVPHLYVNVVVVSLCELDEDSEERQNGLCAEEGAFRPDHGCREQT